MTSPLSRSCSRIGVAVICLLLLALLFPPVSNAADESNVDAYLIKLEGTITDAYAEAIKRKIDLAAEQDVNTLILEMDTPGGTVSGSMNLGDYIHEKVEGGMNIIAYINPQAYSGGTMVALACRTIYIDETLGKMGDVAPINFSGEMVGEKFQAPIRKTMETYARARGYPVPLVHSMVTTDIEVLRTRSSPEDEWRYVTRTDWDNMPDAEKAGLETEVVVPKGQLLTMTAQDAQEYGFVPEENGTVTSRLQLYDVLKLNSNKVQRLYLSLTEEILTYLDVVTPMLLSVGLILLFIEFSNPGFGLPGIAGLVCLALFFTVKFSLGYARLFEIVLFMVGIGLLLAEVFVIPGFGIAGVSGILLIVGSLVLVFQQFTLPSSPGESTAFQMNLLKVMGSLTLSVIAIAVLARFLPSLPVLGKMVHSEDLGTARVELAEQPGQRPSKDMIGDVGVALTALRPAGRADFDGRLMDVVTEGEFLEKGARIEIVAIHGNRVVVTAQRRA